MIALLTNDIGLDRLAVCIIAALVLAGLGLYAAYQKLNRP